MGLATEAHYGQAHPKGITAGGVAVVPESVQGNVGPLKQPKVIPPTNAPGEKQLLRWYAVVFEEAADKRLVGAMPIGHDQETRKGNRVQNSRPGSDHRRVALDQTIQRSERDLTALK